VDGGVTPEGDEDFLNAEDAEDSQNSQKEDLEWDFFCEFCATFALSAFQNAW